MHLITVNELTDRVNRHSGEEESELTIHASFAKLTFRSKADGGSWFPVPVQQGFCVILLFAVQYVIIAHNYGGRKGTRQRAFFLGKTQ